VINGPQKTRAELMLQEVCGKLGTRVSNAKSRSAGARVEGDLTGSKSPAIEQDVEIKL